MVGTKTALHDDPLLTTRLWPGKDPVRVVIDKYLKLPATLNLFNKKNKTIVLNTIREETDGNNYYHKAAEEDDMILAALNTLYKQQLTSLIVEGGTKLIQSFIDADCWDEARVITNKSLLIDNGISAPVLKGEVLSKKEQLLADEICFYKNIGMLLK